MQTEGNNMPEIEKNRRKASRNTKTIIEQMVHTSIIVIDVDFIVFPHPIDK